MSHPVWVRGLKPSISTLSLQLSLVAPRVGAWIETEPLEGTALPERVAPRVGAWIETSDLIITKPESHSRTPCGCVD